MNVPLNPLLLTSEPFGAGRLSPLENFGSNPGHLRSWTFVPARRAEHALPLVVVLHGCTQSAAGYDYGSGWSELASAYGFALLFPEQQRASNANLCFNWFEPGDTRRGAGEALSIAQMIEAMVGGHGIDRQRVFITGLSAGGAMSSVMLAVYPELFAGGAILAGLPHGAATSVQEAFQQMRSPSPNQRTSGTSIKQSSQYSGSWPTVAIWHGTADTVVSPSNADALVRQWQSVHGLSSQSPEEDEVDGQPHRLWRDAAGKVVVEEYRIRGMGHGTPLATNGECGCGEAGAFMLEVGISSTVHSAKAWGLLSENCEELLAKHRRDVDRKADVQKNRTSVAGAPGRDPANSISQVIEDALRKARLMK